MIIPLRQATLAAALTATVLSGFPALALAAEPSPAPASAPASAVLRGSEPDALERSLMMDLAESERTLKASPLVIRDPGLNSYVRGVLCRLVGAERCGAIRLYILRTPQFNATMSPDGVMQVWSGLLVRTQNEAQLAAVLGHEYTHFAERHSIRLYRDVKSKSASATWLAFTGIGLIASFGLAASLFSFSREMEHDADMGGIRLMAAAGYDTREAPRIWEQLREEMDATAAARNTKSRKDRDGGLFATHPPTAERVAYLTTAAATVPGVSGQTGEAAYRAGLGGWWTQFMEDQLKRNDFGASDYLLTSLGKTAWTAGLLYERGELYRRRAAPGDLERADAFYTEAMAGAGVPAEAWRGRGLTRLKLGRVEAARADLTEYLHRAPDAPDRTMIATMAGDPQ